MGLPTFTNLDTGYYDDSDNYGNHQYNSIENIVNNFMFDQDEDSFTRNVDRNRVVYHAKRCVQELYYDVVNEVISIELDLNPTLTIPLPHDYINYVRISWVDDCGKLHEMAIDNTSNLAQAYLQDNDYEYLYDNEGDILRGTHQQDTVGCSPSRLGSGTDAVGNSVVPGYYRSKPFNTDRSKIFKNGSYRIDKTKGVIQFSSSVDGRTIVLDYISDGLFQRDDADIKIHKFAESAMYSYIYHKLVDQKVKVPEREKIRAERQWWNNRRIAKRRIKPMRLTEVRQVLQGGSKWIKD